MSMELLFYLPEDQDPIGIEALDDVIRGQSTCRMLAGDAGYRPFEWRDPATGAYCAGDIGHPPLDTDPSGEARSYPDWRPLALSLSLPLAVPHWYCVEALDLVANLLAALPGSAVLDCENTVRADDSEGPGPLNRMALLASWEQQHLCQTATRTDLHRLARHSSLALWRYRRERTAAMAAHPDHHWPQTWVMAHGPSACTACLWPSDAQRVALPPVDCIIIERGPHSGVLSRDELLALSDDHTPLPAACQSLMATTISQQLDAVDLEPTASYQMLADGDWSD